MSAEILRRAAALMRERAEAATSPAWEAREATVRESDTAYTVATTPNPDDAEHIASWHPAVALAVADWLESEAGVFYRHTGDLCCHACIVARAYLGETS